MDEEYIEEIEESEPVYPEEWGQDDGTGEADETFKDTADNTDAGESVSGDPESQDDTDEDRDDISQIIDLLEQLLDSQGETEEEASQAEMDVSDGQEDEASTYEAEAPDYSDILESLGQEIQTLGNNQELILEMLTVNQEEQIKEAGKNTDQLIAGVGILTFGIGFAVGLFLIRLLFGGIIGGNDRSS